MQNSLDDHIDRIENLIRAVDPIESDCDTIVLSAFAENIIIAAAGLIEIAIAETLYKYCKLKNRSKVSDFFLHSINRYNSLNWQKIKEILKHFNDEWRKEIHEKIGDGTIEEINRIKKNRDNIVHGGKTDIGYKTAKELFSKAKLFSKVLDEVVVGSK